MTEIFICHIVDILSKSITHTFMAASREHAVRQFESFLKSLDGKIHNEDFYLILSCRAPNIPESFDEAWGFICSSPKDSFCGSEVFKDESKS